ncbi:putative secreted protein [Paucimonas lemoignei]|uniref:Putative secreted protein n=1 Tax=Paucimonas lemoignei TaxID=29443 RepID=A0A4R3I1K0_PAULE|nr:PEP-CTERM sorting domain-containing protein [Paucimonas lemoignei]TCS38581.1 putative secreted protein [Paucimonas lemoignei]
MNIFKKALLGLAFISTLGLATSANATVFTVTDGGFTWGSGYGTGNGQLDVVFTNLVTPQTFNLNVGETASFLFGRAQLNETCINSGITVLDLLAGCGVGASELDNLGVTAWLTFTNPVADTIYNVAVTGAIAGRVNSPDLLDFVPDFWIDFSPVVVNFDGTGSFVVDMGDLYFNRTGSITNGYNVTLTAVPEPSSLALLGLGLVGLAGMARRKKQA